MKRHLQKTTIAFVCLLSLLTINFNAHASHTMGADLTYECLGGNQYKVTLSFYRDCIGVAAPASPLVTVSSASCGQSFGVICYPRTGTGQEVTPACSSSVTTCNGGSFTGIQEWVYDGIVNLPMACTDWTFSYSICCRNAAITNINSPGASTFWIYASLNNTISPCNSSPTFSNKPVPFLCQGQQYCFNHGAFDADGDSLAYELITPYQTATTTVNYLSGFNANNPLTSSPATQFNTATGDICLTPQNLEVTVMAVLVKEYRNGVLIGTVERDIQLTVINCANNLPTLSGINGTNNFSMTVCAGQPFCFDIFSSDPDAPQNLTVTWDNNIPAGSFTTDTAQHPTGTFCWTPTSADISTTPYVFTVRVADDACPYIGSQIFSYSITVQGLNVNAGPDQLVACSDIATLTATVSGGTPPYTYTWSNGSHAQSITVGVGTYIVSVTDGVCTNTDTVEVTAPYYPTAAFTNTINTCLNEPIQFTDASTTSGGVIISHYWDFGDSTNSTLTNPTHTFPGSGTYDVTLIIETSLGCTDTLVQPIIIAPPPIIAFTYASECVGSTVFFTDQSTPPASINFWQWYFGDGDSSSVQNPTHVYDSAGTFTVTLIAGDSSSCSDTLIQQIIIYPLPVPNISATTVCEGANTIFTGFGSAGDTISSWYWDFGNGNTGSGTNPNFTFDSSGTWTVTIISTSNHNCPDTTTLTVTVNPLPLANAGPNINLCYNDTVTLTATGGGTYLWSTGDTSASISVHPTSSTGYDVTVTNSFGCTASDHVDVNVNSQPTASAGPDVNICNGTSATLTASGGTGYNWIPVGSGGSSVTVTPDSTTQYIVEVSNASGCLGYDTIIVFVHEPPTVNLTPLFICSGSSSTLDAGNPGSTFVWNTGDTTQIISINSGGNYSVTVTDSYGCSATASCNVTVDSSLVINLANVSFCNGDSVLLDAGYPGNSYLWTTGDTSQTIVVYNSGSYGVTVTDPDGCTGSINISAITNPLPVANFTSSQVCFGGTTLFTDISNVTSGTITSWSWDLGDGNSSLQQNPTHTYANDGTFTVTLDITTNNGCNATYTANVNVNPLPVAAFNVTNACENSSVLMTDLSSVSAGNITGYNWSFGDTQTSTNQNPSHTYTNDGNYNIQLIVTTAGGCTDTVSAPITIYPSPVAGFSSTTVCLNNSTSFTNSSSVSSGSISTYAWDFGDGFTSSANNTTHTYASAGNFNTTLIVVSNNGCSDTLQQNVVVNALPNANAGSDAIICNGATATLTASGGTGYSWTPGGATTASISINPSSNTTYTVTVTDANGCVATDNATVTVNNLPVAVASPDQTICNGNNTTLTASGGTVYNWMPGNLNGSSVSVSPSTNTQYIVSVTDVNGCADSDTVLVTVNMPPNIDIGPNQNICDGSTVQLNAVGGVSYNWNTGDTGSSILVTPISTTSYFVNGTDAAGCTNSDTVIIAVNPVPVVTLAPAFVCAGSSVTLDAGNTGSTFFWSTGATTQTISVSDSGTYSVVVTTSNGCSALGNAYVTVGGSLVVNPTTNAICQGQNVILDAGNPGCTYLWNTGATTQTISVNSAGTFIVNITDPNGCTGSVSSTVSVNPIPVADFSNSSVCLGTMTSFSDLSTVSSGTIQSYSWDFGNGYTSTQPTPTQLYGASGSFNASLTITTTAGCTSTVTHPVTVYALPVAQFSTSPVCLNNTTAFTDQSTGNIQSWAWTFGDGNTSGIQSASNIYTSAGNFNTTLIVTTVDGCRDTVSNAVTVYAPPVAAFTATNACEGANINFNNTSSSSNGAISSYTWNFGDTQSSNTASPTHAYSNANIYNVELIVTTIYGCTDTLSQPVTAYPIPNAAFATTDACANTVTQMVNLSNIASGNISSNYWQFGDGATSNAIAPTHAYQSQSTYNVTLVTTSDHGCVDSVIMPVTIYPLPIVGFVGGSACEGNPIQFNDTSSVGSGSISQWNWQFGDGDSSNISQPAHQYINAGTFNAQLTVTSNNGCSSTASGTINIYPNPVAQFSATSVCFGNGTQFFNQSYIVGGGNLTSVWDYSDGFADSVPNPQHQFLQTGNYNVTLTVSSSYGCVSASTNSMSVYAAPNSFFTANNPCLGEDTYFNDNSSSLDGQIVAWNWNFGDGTFSTQQSPIHRYNTAGNFNVSLNVTTDYGCFNELTGQVSVYTVPTPQVADASACQNNSILFTANNSGTGLNYNWNFGDNTQSIDSVVTHQYNTSGTFDLVLTAVNSYGCARSDSALITIYEMPQVNFAGYDVCAGGTVNFANSSGIALGNISNYFWQFGDGQSSSQSQPQHNYPTAGTYNVTLIATSDHGCSGNFAQSIQVNPNPVVAFNGSLSGCSPLTGTFFDSSSVANGNITDWLWDFGNGDVSTQQNPNYYYTQSGVFEVTLTAQSSFGCTSSYSAPGFVTVYPQPTADFETNNDVLDALNPVIQLYNQSINYTSYQWNFSDGTQINNVLNPVHQFADTGSYVVELLVTNSYGCVDTMIRTFRIEPRSTLYAPNCFTPNGDGINEVFKPEFTQMMNIRVMIFDRWGMLLKEWDGFNGFWDGIYQGNPVQEDVYVYKIEGLGVDNKHYDWIGHVSVVK